MDLIRIGHGEKESLDDFYKNLSDEGFMLRLIKRLTHRVQLEAVFCLTSHRDLVLLSQPNHQSPWWIRIRPLAPVPAVIIEGIGPENHMPWPSARVFDESEDVDDAVEKVIKLMSYTKGWSS